MSEIAKDRLLAVGNRFSSYEQENATRGGHHGNNGSDPAPSQMADNCAVASAKHHVTASTVMPDLISQTQPSTQGGGKGAFWKKNSGKVPGR